MPEDTNCPECPGYVALQQIGQEVDALKRSVESTINDVSMDKPEHVDPSDPVENLEAQCLY
jgi:hypothetical protein